MLWEGDVRGLCGNSGDKSLEIGQASTLLNRTTNVPSQNSLNMKFPINELSFFYFMENMVLLYV